MEARYKVFEPGGVLGGDTVWILFNLERFSSIKDFTFHSFRQYSVFAAADDGATVKQMIGFLAGKVYQISMQHDYISTSKKAINNMAGLLKPETVTSSSPTASSSAEVSLDPIEFLVPSAS